MPTDKISKAASFWRGLAVQTRVIWALVLREMITRYGRENIGILWLFAEPLLFIVGVAIIWTYFDNRALSAGTIAEFSILSYTTILLWRNSTARVIKAIEANKSLLHHRLIRAVDFFYSRIILEFVSVTASFLIIFLLFILLGISHPPTDLLTMTIGWLLIAWFAFGFVMLMGALSEINDVIDKISHVILYFMLPISGAFVPTYVVPEPARDYLLWVPLVNCVEYFRYGYYGNAMKAYYDLEYTIVANLALTLFALALMKKAVVRAETDW